MNGGKQVLIVEDDAAILRGLYDNFVAAGFAVSTAADGQTALAMALANPPELLLLDIMLPKLNGYDLCRRVRNSSESVAILMLTAKGQEDEIVRGLELGADDYMTKPFGIRELMARANRLLRRGGDINEELAIGQTILNRRARKLTRAGVEIALTTKEYRLLEYFVTNPHRALTRTTILDHVWGRSIMVSTRSVDRCVATLRSKIEPVPSRPQFIQTVRDIGYRFEIL